MRRTSREAGEGPPDVTTEWMRGDIAARCRAVLDALAHPAPSAVHLGSTAMLLRGAADDLISLVELIEGPPHAEAAIESDASSPAFGLTFRDVLTQSAD